MSKPFTSIIIPIYNTERYLKECIESVLRQPLKDIDVILMDDGSTDQSGAICDYYAEKDQRVRVFHTENQGHYTARNIAIAEARKKGSAYIGFVDSDDWTEPDMFSRLLEKAEETGADIVECGFQKEYPHGFERWLPKSGVFTTTEALCELFSGNAHDYLWNKLWRTACFDGFEFPPVKDYADAVATYRIYAAANRVACIDLPLYHYRQQSGSIIHQNDMRLLRLWLCNLEKYEYIHNVLRTEIPEDVYRKIENDQLQKCIYAAGKNWAWWNGNSAEERQKHRDELKPISDFVRQHIPPLGRKGWNPYNRISALITRYPNRISLGTAWCLNQISRKIRKKEIYC